MTKDDKIKELLQVLDLPKEEQLNYLWANEILLFEKGTRRLISLADLAFRLRGEVNKITNWWDACQLVYEYVAKVKFGKNEGWKSETGIWFQDFAKPIHWIIATLIAQELSKGE